MLVLILNQNICIHVFVFIRQWGPTELISMHSRTITTECPYDLSVLNSKLYYTCYSYKYHPILET